MADKKKRKKRIRAAAKKRLPKEETILDEGPPIPRGGDDYLLEQRGGRRGAVGTSKVNLRDYLEAVYARVGGADKAIAAAQKHGFSVPPKTLNRTVPIHDTNLINPRGEYDPGDNPRGGGKGERINLGWFNRPTALDRKGTRNWDDVRDSLRHEIDHAINAPYGRSYNTDRLVDVRSDAERLGHAGDSIVTDPLVRAVAGPVRKHIPLYTRNSYDSYRRYMGSRGEVRARALRKIKHWGAEKLGVLPQDEKAARKLIQMYLDKHKPGVIFNSNGPVEADMWRRLLGTKGIEKELLKTVQSASKEQVA